MNAPKTNEPVMWRGAIIGAVLFFGFGLLPYFLLQNPPALFWWASTFALAGGLVGHLGFQRSSGFIGGTLGLTVGLFAGSIAGDQVGGLIPVEAPVIEMAGEGTSPIMVGQPLKIAGPTLEGATFDVADWRGKVVLVDFWATWCPPCLAELPNVKKAYEKYHNDGFEIIGISLDDQRDILAEFVKRKDIAWPQIIFDDPNQRKWENPVAQMCHIRAIPSMFLLDREGRVALVSIEGETLMPAIGQLLAGGQISSDARGLRVELFRMGLFIGACIGGFAGIRFGDFVERLVRRKRDS